MYHRHTALAFNFLPYNFSSCSGSYNSQLKGWRLRPSHSPTLFSNRIRIQILIELRNSRDETVRYGVDIRCTQLETPRMNTKLRQKQLRIQNRNQADCVWLTHTFYCIELLYESRVCPGVFTTIFAWGLSWENYPTTLDFIFSNGR